MTISNVDNQSIWLSMIQSAQQVDSVVKGAVSEANGDTGSPLGVSYEFSKPSELLSQLSQLQSSDPEQFKTLMTSISEKLQAAAESGDVSGVSKGVLSDLADKFTEAAKTGDLSVLQPAQAAQTQPTTTTATTSTASTDATQSAVSASAAAGVSADATTAASGTEGSGASGTSTGGAGGAGGASSASSTEETTTCSVCGATISESDTVCSNCGAVQEDDSIINIGLESTDESEKSEETSGTAGSSEDSRISAYLKSSSQIDQDSMLSVLSQIAEENDSGINANDTFTSIRDLISSAIQEAAKNKADKA